MSKLNKPVAVK